MKNLAHHFVPTGNQRKRSTARLPEHCHRCGLVLLNNAVTVRAKAAPCPAGLDDD